MIIAALIMITYAITLTVAPAVRYHTDVERYQFAHWLGVILWGIAFSFLHQQSMRKLTNRDPYILPVVALLNGIGLMTIWRLYPTFGFRQTIWLAISSLVVFLGFQFPIFLSYLRRYKYIWLILGLVLTALTIFLGSNPSGAGPTLWLEFLGIHFQPSELLKLILIAYLASFFTDRPTVLHRKLENILPTLFVIITALLLLFFQRDMGTASIFLLVYLAMVFTTQENKTILWATPVLVLAAGLTGYFLIDIVQLRIDTWLNPFSDPTGVSYQIIQSMIAIAEGSIIGAGPGLGSPGLIPVSVSDFIFSAIAEESGLLGVVTIILLITILLYRGIKLVIATQNSFHRYLTMGLVFYFGIQSILIIGGNIGLLPLTGVTLPFVSYGGSSLVVSFSALLILLTISHQTPTMIDLPMTNQPRYAIISGLMIVFLIVEIIVTSLISFWFMPSLINRSDNPRWSIEDRFSPRGNILDRDNQVIITNEGEIGTYQRVSHHIPLFPVIGYTNATYGQTGIEASMYSYLRGIDVYPFSTQFLQDLIYNQPPPGLNVRLTIDLDLQQTADVLLEDVYLSGIAGTAILMNASSGEILAMASHPYFNAANLEAEWGSLIVDENAPLINRATQGVYPPGAALFPFLITSQIDLIQQWPDPESLLPNFRQGLICAKQPAEPPTWETLVVNGCQSVQADLAEMAGVDFLVELYQELGFFSVPSLQLNVAGASSSEIIDKAAIYRGEGSFNISPLQMAMAASALSNEGILPGPRIVNAYQDPAGNWITLQKLSSNSQALPIEIANLVSTLLQTQNSPYWQVTATVTTDESKHVTWFTAGTTAEWQRQPIAVVVVLESDAPDLAESIGKSLMEQAIQLATNIGTEKRGLLPVLSEIQP